MADLDIALETFAALLRIAQIESGARRAGFRPLDLTETARTVVDAFRPSAQDDGRTLELRADHPTPLVGGRELITQMLVNLVENALCHIPPGARVEVAAAIDAGVPVLTVTDDGPGVPAAERARLFDRFYRLEASRSTPGSGLGLALAAAVARLHDASISLADAAPGLRVRVVFAAGDGGQGELGAGAGSPAIRSPAPPPPSSGLVPGRRSRRPAGWLGMGGGD